MGIDFKKMFDEQGEKPLDNFVRDGGFTSVFRKICCVGDSLSSGEFESMGEDGVTGYHDMFEYSWGQFLGRMCGSEVLNFSRGGMTASEYCTSFAEANGFWNPDHASQCYIIALGVNDIINMNQPIGDVTDIDTGDYTKNKPTFAGYYAQIIQHLKEIQPRAKFFLMTMLDDPDLNDVQKEGIKAHRDLLYKLSQFFDNAYVLDFYKYMPKYDKTFKEKFNLLHHFNPMGYRFFAEATASYIDYIIRHNMDDFKEIAYIGTDLHG